MGVGIGRRKKRTEFVVVLVLCLVFAPRHAKGERERRREKDRADVRGKSALSCVERGSEGKRKKKDQRAISEFPNVFAKWKKKCSLALTPLSIFV